MKDKFIISVLCFHLANLKFNHNNVRKKEQLHCALNEINNDEVSIQASENPHLILESST